MIELKRERLLGFPEERGKLESAINVILSIFIVLLLCLNIGKMFIFSKVEISGTSMVKTLQNGDLVVMMTVGEPDYGDVVVIKINDRTNYIKRIIGLPGDTIKNDSLGNVYRNGEKLVEDYAYISSGGGTFAKDSEDGLFCITLGEDEIFAMGDNRFVSHDSRSGEFLRKPMRLSNVIGIVPQWAIDTRYSLNWLYRYI